MTTEEDKAIAPRRFYEEVVNEDSVQIILGIEDMKRPAHFSRAVVASG